MSARELKNLLSDLKLTEPVEITERDKRAATRNLNREPEMEEDKLQAATPKGESNFKTFNYHTSFI